MSKWTGICVPKNRTDRVIEMVAAGVRETLQFYFILSRVVSAIALSALIPQSFSNGHLSE